MQSKAIRNKDSHNLHKILEESLEVAMEFTFHFTFRKILFCARGSTSLIVEDFVRIMYNPVNLLHYRSNNCTLQDKES